MNDHNFVEILTNELDITIGKWNEDMTMVAKETLNGQLIFFLNSLINNTYITRQYCHRIKVVFLLSNNQRLIKKSFIKNYLTLGTLYLYYNYFYEPTTNYLLIGN